MSVLLNFLSANALGISVLLLILVVIAGLIVWSLNRLLWMFGWGRYQPIVTGNNKTVPPPPAQSSIGRLVTEFFMKIISQFRHLLALLIFLLFAFVLIYVVVFASDLGNQPGLYKTAADANQNFQTHIETIGKLIQTVVASLGGLVGSIIGYYFGEAGGKSSVDAGSPASVPVAATPQQSVGNVSGVAALRQEPPV